MKLVVSTAVTCRVMVVSTMFVRSFLRSVSTGAVLVGLVLAASAMVACTSKSKTSEPIGHPWFGAARIGDLQSLERQMADGTPVDHASAVNVTALHVASFHGNLKVVKWLIEKGADVNKLDGDGTNPLGYALTGTANSLKLAELVEILIKAGSDPFHQSAIGFVPVEGMVERGLETQLKLLKFTDKKPCDRVPWKDRKGTSLSQIARRAGHVQVAEFLESEGCW